MSCRSNHVVLRVKDPRSPVYATRAPKTCAGRHANARFMARYRDEKGPKGEPVNWLVNSAKIARPIPPGAETPAPGEWRLTGRHERHGW